MFLAGITFGTVKHPNLNFQSESIQTIDIIVQDLKNLGHLWLAYTELQVGFHMLQLISVDSGHFTQQELWL